MDIEIKIVIRCNTDAILSFEQAIETQTAVRKAVRPLITKVGILLQGKADVVATIQVDGRSARHLINLGEHPDDDEDERPTPYPR